MIREVSQNKTKKQNNKIMFYYIYYALQILKNPIKCLQSYYQLTKLIYHKQSTSIFDLIIMNDIKYKISETFNEQFFKLYSSNQFIEIYEVITYEKKKKQFEQKMIDCVNLTSSYYNYLQTNILQYSQIENYSKKLLQQKKDIQDDFQFLSKFAEHNESIVFMGSIYLEAFDQENQTILRFFQDLMRKDRFMNSQFQQQESINPSDGVIYCSLLDKGNKISQFSCSFVTLLNIQHSNIINYDIATFLPTEKQVVEELLYSLHNANGNLQVLNQSIHIFQMPLYFNLLFLCVYQEIDLVLESMKKHKLYNQISQLRYSIQMKKLGYAYQLNKLIRIITICFFLDIIKLKELQKFFKNIQKNTITLTIQVIQFTQSHMIISFHLQIQFTSLLLLPATFFFGKKQRNFILRVWKRYIQYKYYMLLISLRILNILNCELLVDSNIEDHIPCLKNFDYKVGGNFQQNTIFIIDLKNKQVELTPLLNNRNVKQNFDQYLIFDISFKYISVKLETQKVQFSYLEITEFKLIEKEHDASIKINQLKNTIDNPHMMQMDQSRYVTSIIDIKTIAETKFIAETKYFADSKSFVDIKYDSFDINNSPERFQYESRQTQFLSDKKIQFQLDSQTLQTSQPQFTSKISNIQRVESTNREQSPRYLSTFGHNFNEEVNLQSPKLMENQTNEINTLTARDLKTVRYMLEPAQQQHQFEKADTLSNKKSQQVSKSESFQQKPIQQQQVSNKGSSLNSQTSTFQNRIPKKIQQKRMACNLRYFTMIGFISLFQLIIVNWVVYQISKDGITKFRQQFITINSPMSMYIKSVDILRSISYFYLIQDNDKTPPKEERDIENAITQNDQKLLLQSFKDDFFNLIEVENNEHLLDVLSSIEMTSYKLVDRKVTSLSNLTYTKRQSNLLITLEDYLTFSTNTVIFEDQNTELGMWKNIIEFKQKIFIFQEYMKEDMVQVLEQCQMNNIITLIVVICSSVFLVVVVLVVIYVQQMQKKKIISLLGCFTPDILSNKVSILQEQIFEYQQTYILNINRNKPQVQDIQSNKNYLTGRKKNDMSSRKFFKNKMKENKIQTEDENQQSENNEEKQVVKFKKEDLNKNNRLQNTTDKRQNQNQKNKNTNPTKKYILNNQNNYKQHNQFENQTQNKRKRIQANFDKFQALSFHHFALGLLMICILNCQSVVNIIIFEPYQIEQKWLIDEKLKIFDLGATVAQLAAPEILNLEWLWRSYNPLESVYIKFIQSQLEENQQKLLLVKTLAVPATFTMHNQQEYDDFYMQMLSGDICKTKLNYPQYVNSNFTLDTCNTLYQGILTKGLLFALNKAYQEVYSIQDLYMNYQEITPTTKDEVYVKYTQKFINGHNLIEVNSILKFVNESIQSIQKYYHSSCNIYTDYILYLFFTMFIMQIILVQILVILIWVVVNKKLKNEMELSKSYFSLFNSRILSTNSPLNQYFTDFSK